MSFGNLKKKHKKTYSRTLPHTIAQTPGCNIACKCLVRVNVYQFSFAKLNNRSIPSVYGVVFRRCQLTLDSTCAVVTSYVATFCHEEGFTYFTESDKGSDLLLFIILVIFYLYIARFRAID